jgi:hypothetical protein
MIIHKGLYDTTPNADIDPLTVVSATGKGFVIPISEFA